MSGSASFLLQGLYIEGIRGSFHFDIPPFFEDSRELYQCKILINHKYTVQANQKEYWPRLAGEKNVGSFKHDNSTS